MSTKIIKSNEENLKQLFAEKYDVDFYQREYVWQRKQIEDFINDLSTEFLRHWSSSHSTNNVQNYDPYFMGEIVLSIKTEGNAAIIDGQQRFTTFTLLLIYLKNKYDKLPNFPPKISELIYSDSYGEKLFNLDIEERKECMLSLYEKGEYENKEQNSPSVYNIVKRYKDIDEIWNSNINEENIVNFAYWIMEKVFFAKVWTNSDEFAYIIFESMNDRGLSLTQVEMLRGYLLAKIDKDLREATTKKLDKAIASLQDIKLKSKSKADLEFFKIYLRGHFAESFDQKNRQSDFTRIGNEFHRWVRDNGQTLSLLKSEDFVEFINKIDYFANVYKKINDYLVSRDVRNFLYLIVNYDYGFTLQPALILSSIKYQDNDEIISKKIQLVSKYLTKILSWRIWKQWSISQSSMEAPIYDLAKRIRGKNISEISSILSQNYNEVSDLDIYAPVLNKQNRRKIRILLALITEIVAMNSDESNYLPNISERKNPIEIEHIWSNHYSDHEDEFKDEASFSNVRNTIGGLLLLPKSFNSSFGDDSYDEKVKKYFGQNILAKTLSSEQYTNSPRFKSFMKSSKIKFKSYEQFDSNAITERTDLYRDILKWNWKDNFE